MYRPWTRDPVEEPIEIATMVANDQHGAGRGNAILIVNLESVNQMYQHPPHRSQECRENPCEGEPQKKGPNRRANACYTADPSERGMIVEQGKKCKHGKPGECQGYSVVHPVYHTEKLWSSITRKWSVSRLRSRCIAVIPLLTRTGMNRPRGADAASGPLGDGPLAAPHRSGYQEGAWSSIAIR